MSTDKRGRDIRYASQKDRVVDLVILGVKVTRSWSPVVPFYLFLFLFFLLHSFHFFPSKKSSRWEFFLQFHL